MTDLDIPVLETERLRLRGHRASDLDACVRMWEHPHVTRYITQGRPFSREEVWSRLLRNVGHWALNGYGIWLVEDRLSGRFVGEVGFADFKRDLEPGFGDTPEGGWVLDPSAHGAGLATEALGAGLAWLTKHRGSGSSVCMIDTDNASSIRVAVKHGYREYRRGPYKNKEVVLFERAG